MNLSPVLQQRVRTLLGLTGAPEIEAIEAIQPVVQIAAFSEGRQPQNEAGDTLVRKWCAQHVRASLASNHSIIGLRMPQDNTTLVWVQRVIIGNTTGAAQRLAIGRMSNQTALTYGVAGYSDYRLPNNDLQGTLFEVISGVNTVFPTMYSRLDVVVADNNLTSVNVDAVLIGYPGITPPSIYGVVSVSQGIVLTTVSFEGIAFTRVPPF